jgi:SAM-dependent methyltransferase
MENTVNRECPLCGAEEHIGRRHPMSRDQWKVIECGQCRFVYLQNPPVYKELTDKFAWEKLYNADKLRRHPGGKKRLSSRFARKLLLYTVEPIMPRLNIPTLLERFATSGAVLDIGCGDGSTFNGLNSRFIPWGIEISRELAREAKVNFSKYGGEVSQGTALEGLAVQDSNKFTAIVMRSYLEHEISPREALSESFRVLQPGGIIIIKAPNFGSINARVTGTKWCGIRLPAHVNYFRPSELSKIVTDAGYNVMHFNMFRYRPPTSDNMWLIGQKPN